MRRIIFSLLALLLVTSVVAVRAPHTFADPRDFHLTNGSQTLSITAIYIDVTGPGDYSTELLGGATVGPGEGGTVRFNQTDAGKCQYDLLVNFSDGSTREFTGINLCNTTEVTVS